MDGGDVYCNGGDAERNQTGVAVRRWGGRGEEIQEVGFGSSIHNQIHMVYINFKFFPQPFSMVLMQCVSATNTSSYSTDKPCSDS